MFQRRSLFRGPDGRLFAVGTHGCTEVPEAADEQASLERATVHLSVTAREDHESARCMIVP